MQLTPVFIPGESHEQRSLATAVHRVAKSPIGLKELAHTHTHQLNTEYFPSQMNLKFILASLFKCKLFLLKLNRAYYKFNFDSTF